MFPKPLRSLSLKLLILALYLPGITRNQLTDQCVVKANYDLLSETRRFCTFLKFLLIICLLSRVNSPVDLAKQRGEPGKNSKKAEFGIRN